MDRAEYIKQQAKIELAKREFFYYCHLKAPKFYKEDRQFLVDFCKELQDFLVSDDEAIIINMPPRHGKSRTIGCFVEWILGNDQSKKIMTGSYNETLSTTFSKNVRNTITEEKADEEKVVYSDVFPGVRIKQGDGAMNLWSLENGYNNYLATSPTGTATGFGADILIIDDLIKNSYEANNDLILEKHWEWFTQTMLSRLEEGGKIIIVMTRWHSQDLAGKLMDEFKEMGTKYRLVIYKAMQENGDMLCPEILSRKSYENKRRSMGIEIAEANYQQNPIDIKGRLYTSFKTYTKLPADEQGNLLYSAIKNYTDTADTGKDYLCSINYLEYDGEAYILDILYTKDPMEVTEPATAKMLAKNKVNIADIESNSGGRGFGRAVENHLKRLGYFGAVINFFHQSKNKEARILSNATWVMEHIYFPVNWADRWPEYHKAMTKYQREGKNEHDDAPDCTTGIAEKISKGKRFGWR